MNEEDEGVMNDEDKGIMNEEDYRDYERGG